MPILTDGLTNTKIMESPTQLLTGIQKQIRFLMKTHMVRKPCPNCGELHNHPEAAGVAIDEFDFGGGATADRRDAGDRFGKCRGCDRTLIYVLPIMGDWHWVLDPKEATRKT